MFGCNKGKHHGLVYTFDFKFLFLFVSEKKKKKFFYRVVTKEIFGFILSRDQDDSHDNVFLQQQGVVDCNTNVSNSL